MDEVHTDTPEKAKIPLIPEGVCPICVLKRTGGAITHDKDGKVVRVPEVCQRCLTILQLITDNPMVERLVEFYKAKFKK